MGRFDSAIGVEGKLCGQSSSPQVAPITYKGKAVKVQLQYVLANFNRLTESGLSFLTKNILDHLHGNMYLDEKTLEENLQKYDIEWILKQEERLRNIEEEYGKN